MSSVWLANRDGRLCSKCKEGFSPLAYDLHCIKCANNKYNWLKFTAAAFIPLTIFYFIVILFRINATNPYLYGYITLSQGLASPIALQGIFLGLKGKYKPMGGLLAMPYAIWNLDFFSFTPSEYLFQFVNTTNLSFGLCHCCLPTSSCHYHLYLDRASCQRLQTGDLAVETLSQMLCSVHQDIGYPVNHH